MHCTWCTESFALQCKAWSPEGSQPGMPSMKPWSISHLDITCHESDLKNWSSLVCAQIKMLFAVALWSHAHIDLHLSRHRQFSQKGFQSIPVWYYKGGSGTVNISDGPKVLVNEIRGTHPCLVAYIDGGSATQLSHRPPKEPNTSTLKVPHGGFVPWFYFQRIAEPS